MEAKIVCERDAFHFQHLNDSFYFVGIFHFWEYSSEIQELIHHLKYHHGKKLGKLLGAKMADIWSKTANLPQIDWIFPIPLHPVRKRERGFNQSEWIARSMAHELHLAFITNGLIRARNTRTQTRLDAEKRQKNLEEAFKVMESIPIKGKNILLIDDVSTTGATMNAAARELKISGAAQVFGCAIARPTLRESMLSENILYQ